MAAMTSEFKSDAMAVKEFTEGASGKSCPTRPEPMNNSEVSFISKMILDEGN